MPKPAYTVAADALRSPLCQLQPTAGRGDAGLLAAELPHLGYLVLRGRADDVAFMSAVAGVIGAPLPTKPRTALRCAAGVVLWQSPDEWWLLCARSQRDRLVAALEAALRGCFAQVADNSGGFTALRISGKQHLRLMHHLSPYDFESLAVGQCVSTVMSKAGFTLLRSDAQGVTLVFRRSFADYIWRLVERTARPYGLQLTDTRACTDALLTPLLGGAEAQRRQLQPA
ncbi:sarcosine oxidase subunit gamma [Azohydromonas caseinilytica]|uniref:Sarcosine oxidase subunit gamma n=1 Tax=Azohydromonas caseinilytica TaxID=2728836 RepID=A0A848FFK8_9BURK|nr:sarcosine oxidase subunit gamma family protein [Azohydromonas caseinilytica]NML18154.1 sarcosine oxidase subunit gamma [Azohydromonas caseinilytica]